LLLVIAGSTQREAEIHAALSDSRHSGEWYHPTPQLFALMEQVREPQFEVHGTKAFAVLRRRDATAPTSTCPFCGERHSHGPADGHYVAHCTNATQPIVKTPAGITICKVDGYFVRTHGSSGAPVL
jgi:hypothetical protein